MSVKTSFELSDNPTQPPIQSLGVKEPGCQANHSVPPSAEVKKTWIYTFTPLYVFMAECLVKHRDNFTFTLLSENRAPRH
jgi:hypothetical protein